MPYPSTVTSFTNPLPGDKLNSPSHSSIETAQNTGLTEIQTFVGTLSSLAGTLIYDVRSANSNGGGHVQTANKGGTGQTSYTKGDTLVATSTSVLAKLAVGADGYLYTADSSVAGGIKWAPSPTAFSNKIATSASIQTFGSSIATEVSIISVVIPGSTLGVSNALRTTLFVSDLEQNLNPGSVLLKFNYGGNTAGSVLLRSSGSSSSFIGKIEYNLVANGSSVLQRGTTYINLQQPALTVGPVVNSILSALVRGTSSVNTSSDQVLGITGRWSDNSPSNSLVIDGYVVEKIA